MATLTQTDERTWRINSPQINAALTRTDGTPSRALRQRIHNALKPQGQIIWEFRKGMTSKHWYFRFVTGA